MLTLSALTTSSNLINKVSIRHEAESISLLNQFRARPDLGEKGDMKGLNSVNHARCRI